MNKQKQERLAWVLVNRWWHLASVYAVVFAFAMSVAIYLAPSLMGFSFVSGDAMYAVWGAALGAVVAAVYFEYTAKQRADEAEEALKEKSDEHSD